MIDNMIDKMAQYCTYSLNQERVTAMILQKKNLSDMLDNIAVAQQKASWIHPMGVGGGMWWESITDATGSKSLIESVTELLSGEDGSGLESTPNELICPETRSKRKDSESSGLNVVVQKLDVVTSCSKLHWQM
jgi:hypothetical protein